MPDDDLRTQSNAANLAKQQETGTETNRQLAEINKSLGEIHDQLQSIDSAIRAVATTIATKR
jgi:hypothetical protein